VTSARRVDGAEDSPQAAHDGIVRRAFEAFRDDLAAVPTMTLRDGEAADRYAGVIPYDAAVDEPTDAYLEAYARWGLAHVDAASWRHYLPRLIAHALRRIDDPRATAVEATVWSLRPPDRDPPRLGSLSPAQEAVVAEFLEALAFDAASVWKEDALLALEEYWIPNALYRHPPDTDPTDDPL
jgi:hypothetical protein